MKNITGYFLLLALCFPILSFSQLTLEVKGIEEVKGEMFIAVYNSATGFLDHTQAVHKIIIPVDQADFSYTASAIPAGDIAIAIYQDVNQNGELDKALFGIPKEPFGFSNDAIAKFGPPKFSNASFPYDPASGKTVSISLK